MFLVNFIIMDLTVKDLSQELYTELTGLSSFVCVFVSLFLTDWGNKVSSGAPDVSAGSSPLSGGVSPVLWQRVSPTAAYTPLHCNNLHSATLQPTLRQPSLRPPALRTGSCPLEPA